MVGTDDVEHIFLKVVSGSLVLHAGLGVVKYALDAAASGADVAASVATNALGQLGAPKFKSLVGTHRFQASDKIVFSVDGGVKTLTDHLVDVLVLLALAVQALVEEQLAKRHSLLATLGGEDHAISVLGKGYDALDAIGTNLFGVHLAAAADTQRINLVAVYAMLGAKLVERIGIAGLYESDDLSILFALGN